MLDSRLLKGREVSSLLVHAFHSHTPICFLLVILFSLFIFSVFFVFYFFIFLCFFLFLLVIVYCAQVRPFYIACRDKIYHFTPQLLLACCGCPFWNAHCSVGCPATTTTLCWPYHTSFLEKNSFLFFSYFPWHSHLDKGWVSLLLTPIACT